MDPLEYLTPFLKLVREPEVSGPITGVALTALCRLLGNNVVGECTTNGRNTVLPLVHAHGMTCRRQQHHTGGGTQQCVSAQQLQQSTSRTLSSLSACTVHALVAHADCRALSSMQADQHAVPLMPSMRSWRTPPSANLKLPTQPATRWSSSTFSRCTSHHDVCHTASKPH